MIQYVLIQKYYFKIYQSPYYLSGEVLFYSFKMVDIYFISEKKTQNLIGARSNIKGKERET